MILGAVVAIGVVVATKMKALAMKTRLRAERQEEVAGDQLWQVEAVARVIGIESGEDQFLVGLGVEVQKVLMKMIAVVLKMV
jgi:hypothetical protein